MLDVKDAVVRYGTITALHGISFNVEQGEIVTLLGANGAGKSTTLRMLSGLHAPASGQILFEGKDVTHTKAHDFAQLGICHVPEGRRIFPQMTVQENLEMGAFTRRGSTSDDMDKIYATFPILKDRRKLIGANLSGGEQQMLAIARVLRSGARLILLDEPTEGLAPVIVNAIGDLMLEMKKSGLTILLVEQNIRFATRVADRHYLMVHGKIVESMTNAEVIQREGDLLAHLGV